MERPAPLTYVPLFPRANHLAARAIQGWAPSTQHENEGVGCDNAQYPVHSAPRLTYPGLRVNFESEHGAVRGAGWSSAVQGGGHKVGYP